MNGYDLELGHKDTGKQNKTKLGIPILTLPTVDGIHLNKSVYFGLSYHICEMGILIPIANKESIEISIRNVALRSTVFKKNSFF